MAEFDHSVNLENITIITHRLQAVGRIGEIVKNFSWELSVITEYNWYTWTTKAVFLSLAALVEEYDV